ncbi:MAG: cytochrome c biogenesis protein CcsA [Deltaproteobacteria bacterium]|nr:cytochrome c biogenesis protein CcsA [Deltaproteobacteria bacterium]
MSIETFVQHTIFRSPWIHRVLPAFTSALVAFAIGYVFMVTPLERVMGAAQKIFYFHVGSALSAYGAIALVFLSSVMYLVDRKPAWDLMNEAASSIAFLLCSIVLVSGMIWGHSAWNVWFRWEPRLATFLFLWLIVLSCVLLRSVLPDDSRRRTLGAVMGIIAAVNIPIVIFSIKLLARNEQLHPEVVAQQGLQDPRYVTGLLISVAAVACLSVWLFFVRLGNAALRAEVDAHFRRRG